MSTQEAYPATEKIMVKKNWTITLYICWILVSTRLERVGCLVQITIKVDFALFADSKLTIAMQLQVYEYKSSHLVKKYLVTKSIQ